MNILFPIIINLILIGVFVTSILLGKKLGWKASLINLFITAGAMVGGFFLSQISFIMTLHSTYLSALDVLTFKLCVASIIGCVVYTIEIIISLIVLRCKSVVKAESLNTAKIKRAKAIDRKTERILKRQERHTEKISREYRKLSRKSKLFGALICIVTGLLLVAAAYIQIKSTIILVQDKTQIEWLDEGYEYTIPGQLDKII